MKAVHWISLAGVALALVALFSGQRQLAGWATGLVTVIEILAAALTGKRTNDGIR